MWALPRFPQPILRALLLQKPPVAPSILISLSFASFCACFSGSASLALPVWLCLTALLKALALSVSLILFLPVSFSLLHEPLARCQCRYQYESHSCLAVNVSVVDLRSDLLLGSVGSASTDCGLRNVGTSQHDRGSE
ncbi:uncharacterized protein V2V93DRAFT_261230 [Kockiozyma suomiensis]|uniref:uncharacterized protein n=1 Tax=Kockiozyma suomiensis TaxID=1337062 RepID=UPI0033433AEB